MSGRNFRRRFTGPSDLHLHSNHSDGTESPAEVVRRAHAHGVRTVALTDHDRVTGWDEAGDEANALNMTFIPGIELSAKHETWNLHILGYLTDAGNTAMQLATERIRRDRIARAQQIVDNISRTYDLSWQDVTALAHPGASIGRPHIADALVARGAVASRAEAFGRILDTQHGFFEPLYAPDTETAVRLITDSGGVAVIAHPVTSGIAEMVPKKHLEQLIEAGLGGFEIEHRDNDPAGKDLLRELARAHDLVVTGSSDYHGAGKPNVPGENTTVDGMVTRIIERATGTKPRYAAATHE